MEKSSHVHGSKDLILFRWKHSSNGFTDSMQHLTKSQQPIFLKTDIAKLILKLI